MPDSALRHRPHAAIGRRTGRLKRNGTRMARMHLERPRVYFVVAGPGAIDLLTLRGARILERADVVLHDALVEPAVLALAQRAQLIAVGKRAHQPSTAQRFINKTLVDSARKAGCVVRLKGGDPSIFGRLDEEMQALREAGITFEVVPGITAASAAAAELQASLTLRGVARAVTFITPCVCDEHDDATWGPAIDSLRAGGSLGVYMAGRHIAALARRLIEAGQPRTTRSQYYKMSARPTHATGWARWQCGRGATKHRGRAGDAPDR